MQISGSSLSATTGFQGTCAPGVSQRAKAAAQEVMDTLDTDGDGQLSLSELKAGEEAAEDDVLSAKEVMKLLDSDGNGGLSLEEVSAIANREPPQGAQGAGGQPPGPPPGPPPAGGGSDTDSAGSSEVQALDEVEVFDPADTNQDGEVSEAERLAYAQQKASASYTATAAATA